MGEADRRSEETSRDTGQAARRLHAEAVLLQAKTPDQRGPGVLQVGGEGFEPPKALASRFTACPV